MSRMTGQSFWRLSSPSVRIKVEGLHPLTCGARWNELTAAEQRKVEEFVKGLYE